MSKMIVQVVQKIFKLIITLKCNLRNKMTPWWPLTVRIPIRIQKSRLSSKLCNKSRSIAVKKRQNVVNLVKMYLKRIKKAPKLIKIKICLKIISQFIKLKRNHQKRKKIKGKKFLMPWIRTRPKQNCNRIRIPIQIPSLLILFRSLNLKIQSRVCKIQVTG